MSTVRTPHYRPCVMLAPLLVACAMVALATNAAGQPALEEFRLQEHFGVSHANQVVFFELQKQADPGRCHLLDEAGHEVPFQMVEGGPHGSIAFCMDLPANAARTFKLRVGRGPTWSDGVNVDESHSDCIEITNGLTGVRVPKVYAPLSTTPKAPIQGVQASWTLLLPRRQSVSRSASNNGG